MVAMNEAEVREAFTQLNSKLEKIGNLVHDSVEISHDEVMIWHIGFASICLHIMLNLNGIHFFRQTIL